MVLPILASLGGASGVGSILAGAGGVMSALGIGKSGADAGDINRMNVANARVNARRLRSANAKLMRQQRAYERRSYRQQRRFYQHRIRWAAEDARRAGFHPLFGVGQVGTGGFSPVGFQGASDFSPIPGPVLDSGGGVDFGGALSSIGNALSGVFEAKASIERDQAIANYYNSMARRAVDPQSGGSDWSYTWPLYDPNKTDGGMSSVMGHPIMDAPPESMSGFGRTGYAPTMPGKDWRSLYDQPGLMGVNFPGEKTTLLPFSQDEGWSETIQQLPIAVWPDIWKYNRDNGGNAAMLERWLLTYGGIAGASAVGAIAARFGLKSLVSSIAKRAVAKRFWKGGTDIQLRRRHGVDPFPGM